MNFGMIVLNQSIKIMQNCTTWIQIVNLFTLKIKNAYEDIADNVQKRFDTSNYEVNRPLPTRKNKNVI